MPLPSPAPAGGPILPGATLGVLGGGQLGAMFAAAATRMGYRVEAVVESADCPAARHARRIHVGLLDDPPRLLEAARAFAAVTYEFENVPVAAARALEGVVPVRPGPEVLFVTQDRGREKAFLARHGFPCAPHGLARTAAELAAVAARVGFPGVVKTCASGYDGKGQRRVESAAQVAAAWDALGPGEVVFERWIPFRHEVSVIAARGLDGAVVTWEPSRNVHTRHILDVSVAPSGLDPAVVAEARRIAAAVLGALDVVGVACVEFFVDAAGGLLVNEIAPRPHNSGHLTIEGADTSQFEQQLRAVCGLPLGSTRPRGAAAMANLLGDCWARGEPDWQAALATEGVSLHLYGKSDPRPGRKVGHLTALAPDAAAAERLVREARRRLSRGAVD
ncbi:MAG: 5-(carboxyamino)imidazole ribonucleotide synthase [Planctomycetaceae bacterium]